MPNKRAEALNERDWISASSAARTLGIHRDSVLRRAAKGAYRVKTIDGVPYLHRRDVERAAKREGKDGLAIAS
jgi:hypothetical protein